MSDDNQETVQQHADRAAPVSNIGATLIEARERLGLSIEEAAQQLRLGSRQLQALENNDYASLPGVTFVRGFLRNYARLLHLDPEPLLQVLHSYTQDQTHQPISLHSEKITIVQRNKKFWLPYAIASVLVGLALGGWMAYMDHHESRVVNNFVKAPESAPAKSVVSEPVKLSDDQSRQPSTEPLTPPDMTPSPVVETPVQTVAVPTLPAVAGSARLKFIFSQRVWVRVEDRNGNEIFNKTKAAGSEDMAEGLPPFKVSVGNAAGVQMTFNDKPVDLAPYTRANVARFTLE